MSHSVIIRGGNYASEDPLVEGQARNEIEWAPPHDMSIEEEGELFKAQLRRYKKSVSMDVG